MATLEELQSDISGLQNTVNTLNSGFDAVTAKVTDLKTQISSLQAQVAAGGVVSQSDLDGLDASVKAIADVASQAQAKEDAVNAA